jgi:hypothetical protein
MTVGFARMMLDRLAEAEKGGHFGRLIPVSAIDTTRIGCERAMVHPQWIFGKGPQRGTGSDPAT